MAFLDAAPRALIGMEACPGSQWLARRLAAMGHGARIIPARFVKPYVKSNKTDTVDAAAIAEAVTRPTMRFVEVRTPEQVDLQALHRIRDRLVGQRTALMNQARAFCLEYGLAMRVGGGGFHADIRRHLANAENDLTPAMRGLLEELLDDLAYVEGRIKTVNGKVEAYASRHDAVSRLVTIPGIGALGATAIVAAAGDGRQFRKARDLAAWLGLVPAEHSTGGKQTLLGISKRGKPCQRAKLFISRGVAETAPCQTQAESLAALAPDPLELRQEPDRNHLNLVLDLADPDKPPGWRPADMVADN